MGLFTMAIELVGISAAISGVRRATGLSLMNMAKTKIKNENVRVFALGYLKVGEATVDFGQSMFNKYKKSQKIDQKPFDK
mmetsp:Transcript_20368/g.34759  ORF Transcript_20368/g.34759 Transcript_20368/m.34759 type:complete len:80 (+) Transcript_20368:61-300(+)